MRRVNLRINLIILTYSLFMTACLLAGLFVFVDISKPKITDKKQQVLFYADNGSLLGGLSSGEIKVDINFSVNLGELDALYKEQFTRYLPMGVIVICVFVFITSTILWLVLKRIYKKELQGISGQLKLIKNNVPFDISGEPLKNEYQGIIDKFQ